MQIFATWNYSSLRNLEYLGPNIQDIAILVRVNYFRAGAPWSKTYKYMHMYYHGEVHLCWSSQQLLDATTYAGISNTLRLTLLAF